MITPRVVNFADSLRPYDLIFRQVPRNAVFVFNDAVKQPSFVVYLRYSAIFVDRATPSRNDLFRFLAIIEIFLVAPALTQNTRYFWVFREVNSIT